MRRLSPPRPTPAFDPLRRAVGTAITRRRLEAISLPGGSYSFFPLNSLLGDRGYAGESLYFGLNPEIIYLHSPSSMMISASYPLVGTSLGIHLGAANLL